MTDPHAAPPPNAGDNHDSTPAVKRDHDRPPPAEPDTAANNGRNPDYPGMIIDAIRAMNERGGSNRRTIGKFMEDNFSARLPSSIDWDLLTHYLQAMKNSGHLLTANKSYYMLSPSSDSLPTFPPPPPPGGDGGSTSGFKRSRVRPLKHNPDNGSDGPSVPVVTGQGRPNGVLPQDGSTSGLKRGRGGPPMPKLEDRVKRRRGRPRKNKACDGSSLPHGPSAPEVLGQSGPQDGSTSGLKGGRGRPPMPKLEDRVKSRRGRPRKDKACDGSSLPHGPSAPEVVGQSGPKRGRGRPRKDPTSNASPAATEQEEHDDLKDIFEYMQARIKETVDEVKPHVNNKSALRALQELEELARTITSARDERVRRGLRPRRETRRFKP